MFAVNNHVILYKVQQVFLNSSSSDLNVGAVHCQVRLRGAAIGNDQKNPTGTDTQISVLRQTYFQK